MNAVLLLAVNGFVAVNGFFVNGFGLVVGALHRAGVNGF